MNTNWLSTSTLTMQASMNSCWSSILKQTSNPQINLRLCASWKSYVGCLLVKSFSPQPQTHCATSKLLDRHQLKGIPHYYHVVIMLFFLGVDYTVNHCNHSHTINICNIIYIHSADVCIDHFFYESPKLLLSCIFFCFSTVVLNWLGISLWFLWRNMQCLTI